MGNAITPDARALWLMLARQGGWWTVKNITQFWTPTFVDYEVEDLLQTLVPGGYVMSRQVNPGQVSFAVTSECNPLPGIQYAGSGSWKEAA